MATLTIRKSNSRVINIEVNLDQWERLADIFGFYQEQFIKSLKKSIRESKEGRVRKIKSLLELEK
jgi:hypothetical protein